MIQRIQSVYLLLASLLSFSGFLFTFWHARIGLEGSDVSIVTIDGQDNRTIFLNLMIIGVIGLATIFMYKNRLMQIKFGKSMLGLSVLFVVLVGYFIYNEYYSAADIIDWGFGWGLIIPVLIIIFVLLAIRAIRKDEELVRSADRFR